MIALLFSSTVTTPSRQTEKQRGLATLLQLHSWWGEARVRPGSLNPGQMSSPIPCLWGAGEEVRP